MADEPTPHTSTRFDDELRQLRALVEVMGRAVQLLLGQAVAVTSRGEPCQLSQVAEDERVINQLEIDIDDYCSRVLATKQPAASDLRLVVGMLKAATDLERIGDESKKIIRLGTRLRLLEPHGLRFPEQRHLAELVAEILDDALDAFHRGDAGKALEVARRDRLVDEEYERIQRQCVTFMMEDPRAIRRTLDLMWIVRALERIGDHATNLCEHAVYVAAGLHVRHRGLDEARQGMGSPAGLSDGNVTAPVTKL
jgi:phosphate transport system protein